MVLTDRATAIRVALDDAPRGVSLHRISDESPDRRHKLALTDDRRRDYDEVWSYEISWEPYGEHESNLHILSFDPLQPLARRLTLRVPEAELILPNEASFDVTVPRGIELEPRFEVTEEPPFADPPHTTISWRSSDPWDIDVTLEAAGYRVELTQSRLEAASHQLTHGPVERSRRATQLALTSEPLRLRPGGYRLTYVPIASATGPNGEDVRLAGGLDMRGLFEERFPPETRHRVVLTFGDLENEPVPPGRYHIEVDEFWVLVEGPWELSWDLPGP